MMRISVALAVALLWAIPASATDAQTVLAASRQSIQTAGYRTSGHLVRIDSSGARAAIWLFLPNAPKGPISHRLYSSILPFQPMRRFRSSRKSLLSAEPERFPMMSDSARKQGVR